MAMGGLVITVLILAMVKMRIGRQGGAASSTATASPIAELGVDPGIVVMARFVRGSSSGRSCHVQRGEGGREGERGGKI